MEGAKQRVGEKDERERESEREERENVRERAKKERNRGRASKPEEREKRERGREGERKINRDSLKPGRWTVSLRQECCHKAQQDIGGRQKKSKKKKRRARNDTAVFLAVRVQTFISPKHLQVAGEKQNIPTPKETIFKKLMDAESVRYYTGQII